MKTSSELIEAISPIITQSGLNNRQVLDALVATLASVAGSAVMDVDGRLDRDRLDQLADSLSREVVAYLLVPHWDRAFRSVAGRN